MPHVSVPFMILYCLPQFNIVSFVLEALTILHASHFETSDIYNLVFLITTLLKIKGHDHRFIQIRQVINPGVIS